MSTTYTYEKASVNSLQLHLTIVNDDDIEKTLETVDWNGGTVLKITFAEALSQDEKDELDSDVSNHSPHSSTYLPNVFVEEYDKNKKGGKVKYRRWYDSVDGNGDPQNIAKQIEYTWSGNKLMSEIHTEYWDDGTVKTQETWNWYWNSTTQSFEKYKEDDD